ncbi:predicted protein [Pyrenophora tritici-repentis Pt-1C-BFP]|uniref:Uncharacterized protein n=1 Tax=Pyrenophora tritici-repentis (strain Pt-1C-BFP) TaxID=426418 RepID=B2WC06_PYRTR|nr:uncharacterized protein PTRG_07515 [Pyrenophora tritici-repentis Pt-1C-BFP]EDU50434.1 predicted protein [Pyrenophora tritici-repentis Pt-1C-BFP]
MKLLTSIAVFSMLSGALAREGGTCVPPDPEYVRNNPDSPWRWGDCRRVQPENGATVSVPCREKCTKVATFVSPYGSCNNGVKSYFCSSLYPCNTEGWGCITHPKPIPGHPDLGYANCSPESERPPAQ